MGKLLRLLENTLLQPTHTAQPGTRLPAWVRRKLRATTRLYLPKAPAASEAPATQQPLARCQETCLWTAHPLAMTATTTPLQLGLRSAQLLGIKGTLCGPRKSACGLSQCKVQGCRRWMDGDRRRGEKSRRSNQEAHTAGRSPSPAVGRAVSFDKALGSTPSSVVSGLRKHTRSTSLPVGGLQPCFVFFLSFIFLSFRRCPSPSKEPHPSPTPGQSEVVPTGDVGWAASWSS